LAGNADIREVQQVLIDKGFYHGRIDGVMGRETMDALMQFQRREGLEATGRIDERTTAALGISGQGRGATDGRGDQGQGRGATEGRGDQGQGRFEQRQGKPEPNRAGQTSGQGRNRDLNGRQENQSRTGAQDRRNQPGQGEPPSTSGQGGTQGRGQSARPQNQTAPNGSGGNEQRRRPGER
jgi:peptidoglycan hydrolase-like protein with peptidoglycan-binding domain